MDGTGFAGDVHSEVYRLRIPLLYSPPAGEMSQRRLSQLAENGSADRCLLYEDNG